MIYEIGNKITAPGSWNGRVPTCQSLGTNKLEVMRQTLKTIANTRKVGDEVVLFISLVFIVGPSTLGKPWGFSSGAKV